MFDQSHLIQLLKIYLLVKFGGHRSSVLTWKKLNSPPRSAISGIRTYSSEVPDAAGIKTRRKRRRTQTITKRYALRNNFSAKKIFIAGFLQGSNHEPLLIHLCISDFVFVFTEAVLSNYVDNNKLFSIGKDSGKIKALLAKYFGTVTNWFHENVMVSNSKKCHFMYCKK